MTALACSPTYGVVKRAQLVIVKTLQHKLSDQVDAFRMVHDDIVKQKANGVDMTPVINYSRNIRSSKDIPLSDEDLRRFYRVLETLIKEDGAVVVANSGNHANDKGVIDVSDSRRLNVWLEVI